MSFDDTDPSGPCAGADLCCVCTPKLGCLYCLLGSHPSRSVCLCLDIKGKNWRTGSKLESLPRQGSFIILLLLEIFYRTYLQIDLWETRAATSTCFNTGQNHTPKLKTHTHTPRVGEEGERGLPWVGSQRSKPPWQME